LFSLEYLPEDLKIIMNKIMSIEWINPEVDPARHLWGGRFQMVVIGKGQVTGGNGRRISA
jgi:hypothetical protein